jgi:hypothetical protein
MQYYLQIYLVTFSAISFAFILFIAQKQLQDDTLHVVGHSSGNPRGWPESRLLLR